MRNFDSGFRRNLTDNRKNNYALIFNIIIKKVRTWYVQDTYQVLLLYIYFILYLFLHIAFFIRFSVFFYPFMIIVFTILGKTDFKKV